MRERSVGTIPIPLARRDPEHPAPAEVVLPPPSVPGSDARRRLTRLLLLRVLVISVVLGLSLWLLIGDEPPARAAVWFQSGLIATTYLSSIVFGLALRRGLAPRRVAAPMQATDLAITSLLVYVTGGAQSPYTFLYALSIVSAGAISYRRGAVVVTAASLALATVVSLFAWTHALALPMSARAHPWDQAAVDLVRTLGVNYAAITGVGVLAFIFGDQLEKGAEAIASTRREVADLYTLHQDIVRSLASGLITYAPDGTVLTANHAAGEILRRTDKDLLGQNIASLLPGLGSDGRSDLVIDNAGGKELFLGATVSPLRDVHDQVIGRVVNFSDLTELRHLEQQRNRSERLVTVGHLAAGIAHEIRNPLASISGSIELLKQAPQASDDDRTLMNIVHREIDRLNVLIGDLLDYANPRPRQEVDFDLANLVDEVMQVARADQAFAAVEMTSELPHPFPLHADPAKLRQVVWNLVRNAADAATKKVTVTARRADDGVTITIADDGKGIAAEQLAKIFDPFFTTKAQGTGLGLATCHALVAEHGGRIDVESDVGRGTKMVVRIPEAR